MATLWRDLAKPALSGMSRQTPGGCLARRGHIPSDTAFPGRFEQGIPPSRRRSLPRPGSQWLQWIDAIRAGKPGDTNFQYAGRVAEVSLLGNIAIRNKEKVLHFDAKKGKFTDEAANKLLNPPFREGWALPT